MLLFLVLACGGEGAPTPPPAPPALPTPPPPSLGGVSLGAPFVMDPVVCEDARPEDICREATTALGMEGELLAEMAQLRFLSPLTLAGLEGELVLRIADGQVADLAWVHPDAAQAEVLEAWLGTEGWVANGESLSGEPGSEGLVTLRFYRRGAGEAWVVGVSEDAGLAMRPSDRVVGPEALGAP
ncbi:MAG: hypothetical protein H6741_20350 [Alphaproteobacteria bacterium]|nr:hypothetical protein [Alphaproteobacteria bacterium]